MTIKNIAILNYRSCIKTKLNLPENLTALIGINGVGKSNILTALQLIKKGLRRHSYYSYNEKTKDHLLETTLEFTFEIEKGKKIFINIKVYYETDESNTDDVHSLDVKYRIDDNNSLKKWNKVDDFYIEVASYMNQKKISDLPSDKRLQNQEAMLLIPLLLNLYNTNYYSATRFSDPSKCPISFELEDERLSSRSYRNNRNHESFLFELYSAYKFKKNIFQTFLEVVNEEGMHLIENISFFVHEIPSSSYKVRTGGKIEKIERARNIVIPSIIIDGLSLSPNQLSEGTFKTLALVFNIINDQSKLLLIEEPEVCVHHGLLNSIIELIKVYSEYKQIIISTHSDFVLDKLKPENIILVEKKEKIGTTALNLTKKLSSNEYAALKDYLLTTGNLGEYWKEGGFDND